MHDSLWSGLILAALQHPGVKRRVSTHTHTPHRSCSVGHRVHLKMRKGALALLLLLLLPAFASHGTWCEAAPISTMADAALEAHEIQGKRLLEMVSPRKLGHMGGGGPGGGASGGGRHTGTGGGAANTRPHNTKNSGAVALPALVTSVLALVFTTAILLSGLGSQLLKEY